MLTRLDYKTALRLFLFDELIIPHYMENVNPVELRPRKLSVDKDLAQIK